MERKLGALISPKDFRDYQTNILAGVSAEVVLPENYRLPQTLIVKDQGNVNSCVAHSISSMMEAEDNVDFSTGWIYGYRPSDYWQGEGMYMREALKTVKNLGAVEEADFGVNVEMQEAKKLVDDRLFSLETFAEDNRITSYARLNSIEEIKAWLIKKTIPVPISILVDNMKLDKKNIVQIPDKTRGGHAVIIIGWNELGFIIQNSWGKEWGNDGTAILPYEYQIQEAWGIDIDNSKNIHKPTFFIIRRILQWLFNLLKEVKNNGNKEGNN